MPCNVHVFTLTLVVALLHKSVVRQLAAYQMDMNIITKRSDGVSGICGIFGKQ